MFFRTDKILFLDRSFSPPQYQAPQRHYKVSSTNAPANFWYPSGSESSGCRDYQLQTISGGAWLALPYLWKTTDFREHTKNHQKHKNNREKNHRKHKNNREKNTRKTTKNTRTTERTTERQRRRIQQFLTFFWNAISRSFHPCRRLARSLVPSWGECPHPLSPSASPFLSTKKGSQTTRAKTGEVDRTQNPEKRRAE
jgi:hypothetical protein